MARKPLEIPPEIAAEFVKDMKAFFEAEGQLKQDEIASRTVRLLRDVLPKGTKIGKTAVKELFYAMRGEV